MSDSLHIRRVYISDTRIRDLLYCGLVRLVTSCFSIDSGSWLIPTSLASKAQLIQVTLQSIPVYFLSLLKNPLKFLQ